MLFAKGNCERDLAFLLPRRQDAAFSPFQWATVYVWSVKLDLVSPCWSCDVMKSGFEWDYLSPSALGRSRVGKQQTQTARDPGTPLSLCGKRQNVSSARFVFAAEGLLHSYIISWAAKEWIWQTFGLFWGWFVTKPSFGEQPENHNTGFKPFLPCICKVAVCCHPNALPWRPSASVYSQLLLFTQGNCLRA